MSPADYPLPSEALDRYLAGDGTPEERARIEHILLERPELQASFDRMQTLRFTAPMSAGRREAMWTRLSAMRSEGASHADDHLSVNTAIRPASARRDTSRISRWAAMAAAASILVGGLGLSLLLTHRPASPTPDGMGVAASLNEVATGRSQRATVQLTDGSHVILGVESRIRYARDFGKRSREVELEGEAYFDVVHDTRVPFRVLTSHGVSEDIGTRFSVRAYAGEQATRVVVEAGRVGVGHGITLAAGDLARLTTHAPPAVQHGVPVRALLGWIRGQPSFVNVPLRDVLADVRRWYDVDVRLGDPALGDVLVIASFGKVPISRVLESLARAADARLERRGDRWVFVPKARSTP